MQRRRGLGPFVFAVLVVAVHCVPASAQDYPARPIRLIVSSPAGSLVDVLSRLLTQELGARLGQSIVVDNRAGAMTQVALDALVRAPPDGCTLMIGPSEMAMMPFLKKSYSYRSRFFQPVTDAPRAKARARA
jgi:tripartite-type tricarboxylate transporter receptor subunit TctC